MKNRFGLQFFADPEPNPNPVPVSDPEPNPNQNPGPKPGEPKPGEPKYTDKDLDDILNKKFAKWQEQKQKDIDEAKKLAEMNAAQKAEYERDKLKEELDGYKKKNAMSEMTTTARKMLSDNGIAVSDDLISVIVTDDADKTKAAIDGFSAAFNAAVEDAVKERLKGNPPHRGSGSPTKMTKDQIMEIKDPAERQRLINENRDLFGY